MINALLNWHSWNIYHRSRSKYPLKALFYISKFLVLELCHFLVPILLRCSAHRYRLTARESSPRLIVSLTSFPARINVVWMVVEMMFRQSVKPDMVVLYLSKSQFPSVESLPKSLQRQCSRGLVVRFVEEDLRSHNKYYYAMRDYPLDTIVTVDDDILYPATVVESLVKMHEQNPEAVIANRTHTLSFDEQGELLPYNDWSNLVDNSGYNLFLTGVNGVLYPPCHTPQGGTLYKDIFDSEQAMRLTPYADDVWLFAQVRLGGNRVLKSDFDKNIISLRIRNNRTLVSDNCGNNRNDLQINALRDYYKETLGVDSFADKRI